jgi:hypothetical protein
MLPAMDLTAITVSFALEGKRCVSQGFDRFMRGAVCTGEVWAMGWPCGVLVLATVHSFGVLLMLSILIGVDW